MSLEATARPIVMERPKATTSKPSEPVPKTLGEALTVFWLGEHHGPRTIAALWLATAAWRLALDPLGLADALIVPIIVALWCLQEHWMHGHLLHSETDWIGKAIHIEHHAKPYHHISIDSAALMLAWLSSAHALLRLMLPLPLALTATLAYAGAGLVYEWAHYISHTRVRFAPHSYWARVKDHHVRHHQVDARYWLGFTVPAIDDVFATNPNVRAVREEQRQQGKQRGQ